jgi:hypothetical protein
MNRNGKPPVVPPDQLLLDRRSDPSTRASIRKQIYHE